MSRLHGRIAVVIGLALAMCAAAWAGWHLVLYWGVPVPPRPSARFDIVASIMGFFVALAAAALTIMPSRRR